MGGSVGRPTPRLPDRTARTPGRPRRTDRMRSPRRAVVALIALPAMAACTDALGMERTQEGIARFSF
jgi:hypothetical protein